METSSFAMARPELDRADAIIKRLRGSKEMLEANPGAKVLPKEDVDWLIERAQACFESQPMLIEVGPPVAICGDTHGQFVDLLRLFEKGRFPIATRYLFLGDYVDRGPNGVEVICIMLAYKIRYCDDFYVLRGNHETESINRVYGFYDEVRAKYDKETYRKFNQCFDWMPLAAVVGGAIFCMHGGISPELTNFDQIRALARPLSEVKGGLAADLLWADPDKSVQGFKTSPRGVSHLFGEDAVDQCCNNLRIDIIIRAHQVFDRGYEFFANKKLLTVFSAPDYCNQYNNAAGFVAVNKALKMKILTLRSKTAAESGVSAAGSLTMQVDPKSTSASNRSKSLS